MKTLVRFEIVNNLPHHRCTLVDAAGQTVWGDVFFRVANGMWSVGNWAGRRGAKFTLIPSAPLPLP